MDRSMPMRSTKKLFRSYCSLGLLDAKPLLFRFMQRHLNRLDEVVAQCGDLLRLHEAFLQPQPIIHRERLVFFNRVFETGTEPTIFPFTEPGLLGVSGMVEVGHRVSLSAKHKRHRVPRQVDRPLAGLWIPIASFAGFSPAVRANIDSLLGGKGVDVVVRTEL